MTTKDTVLRLKESGAKNSEIAELLDVSRQYVSHVCRTRQNIDKKVKGLVDRNLLTVGAASRLLGVHPSTIRRWCDDERIPSFRIGFARKDRRLKLSDLRKFVRNNGRSGRIFP